MSIYQFKSQRKPTGGMYHKLSKKKKMWLGNDFLPVRLGSTKAKPMRGFGGNIKMRLLAVDRANVTDPATGKTTPNVKIITVKENKADPNFVRMNIITKGAIIETEVGLAKVMSRPSQHGVVNAMLIKK
ncbi:MAG: 30S ribosomal protein S8e [Candidatus Aenigmatarchaeota archaeon]|nr:30S ribosomal protein S8e [Candidatus Aenigmarchaeota archaeon]